jgi:hypothetical protein
MSAPGKSWRWSVSGRRQRLRALLVGGLSVLLTDGCVQQGNADQPDPVALRNPTAKGVYLYAAGIADARPMIDMDRNEVRSK